MKLELLQNVSRHAFSILWNVYQEGLLYRLEFKRRSE